MSTKEVPVFKDLPKWAPGIACNGLVGERRVEVRTVDDPPRGWSWVGADGQRKVARDPRPEEVEADG